MDKIVKNITIGIRHKRIFKIRDNFGKFIDCILHNHDSPFSVKYFPFIDEKPPDAVILHNENGENFQINMDDFSLRINTEGKFTEKITNLKDNILPFLKKRIFNITKIDDITRVGIVFLLEFPSKGQINKIIAYLTDKKIESINDFEMRFSKKLSISESLSKKGVNDYANVIYKFVKKKDKMFVNFDFQRYFEPELKDINDFNLDVFLDDAVIHLKESYNKWLKNYEEEQNEDSAKDSPEESEKGEKKKKK